MRGCVASAVPPRGSSPSPEPGNDEGRPGRGLDARGGLTARSFPMPLPCNPLRNSCGGIRPLATWTRASCENCRLDAADQRPPTTPTRRLQRLRCPVVVRLAGRGLLTCWGAKLIESAGPRRSQSTWLSRNRAYGQDSRLSPLALQRSCPSSPSDGALLQPDAARSQRRRCREAPCLASPQTCGWGPTRQNRRSDD